MALPRRGLDEVLGDPSFAPQEGKANAGELKQRLRSYAALLRAAVMPSSKSPFGRDFVGKRLAALAVDRGLSCDFDEDSESYLIATAAYFVEVAVDSSGVIRTVKVVHGAEDDEEDPEMLALLAAGDFDGVYAAIGRLEQIHRPHPTLEEDSSDRFNKLLVFEKEITEICSTEADTHSPAAVLSRGHGIVRPRLGSQVLRLAYHSPTQNDPAETLAAATERLFGAVDTAYVDIMVADASTTMDTLPPSEKLATCIAAPRGSEDGATSVLTFEAYAGPPDTLFTLSLLPAQPVFCHTEIAMDIFEVAYGRPPSHGGADAGRMGVAGPRDFLSAVIEQSGGPAAGSPFHFYPRKGCSGGVMLERVDIRSTRQLLAVLQRLRQQLVVNALLKSCVQAASAGSVQAAELSLVGPGHITLQLQHPVTERLCSVDISVQINGDVGCRITTLPSDPAPCSDADFLSALQDRLSIPEALEKTWAGTERAPKRSRTET